jgi:hypothetical protein
VARQQARGQQIRQLMPEQRIQAPVALQRIRCAQEQAWT